MVGTPSALPVASPKLLVMSVRTTPLSASAFGPFEPSPGYGPAVSSGISLVLVAVLVLPVVLDSPHAARNAAAAPPVSTLSARRRLISRGRS